MSNVGGATPRLLKKSELLRLLNVSKNTFEKSLSDGTYPQPFLWVTPTLRGRRWHSEDVRRCFGLDA